MKCDKCDNEATVHEIVIVCGEKVEKHLCESHAREEGLMPAGSGDVGSLLSEFVQPSGTQLACPDCGLKWTEFRQHGLLGCPSCYETYEEKLVPLLERAQEGGASHVGKSPGSAGERVSQEHEATKLRKELADALSQERYEQAAKLRDLLRELGESVAGERGAEAS